MKLKLKLFVCAVVVTLLTSCAAPSYDVTVYVSPKLKEAMKVYPSLEVDIVGVNDNEAERFSNAVVHDYFQANSSLRKGTDHFTMFFSEDSITPKLLGKHDHIWKSFGKKDADKLYLLVNLPVDNKDKKDSKDGSKIVIPLENGLFSSDKRYFEITPAGITELKEKPVDSITPEKVTSNKKD